MTEKKNIEKVETQMNIKIKISDWVVSSEYIVPKYFKDQLYNF